MAKKGKRKKGGSKPHLRASIIPKDGSRPDIKVPAVEGTPYEGPSAYAVRVISSMVQDGAGEAYTVVELMRYASNGFTPAHDGTVAPDVQSRFERKVLAELTRTKLVTRTENEAGEAAYQLADRAQKYAVGDQGEGLLKHMEPGRSYGIPELQRLGGRKRTIHAVQNEFLGGATAAGLIEQTHAKPPAYRRLEERVETFLR